MENYSSGKITEDRVQKNIAQQEEEIEVLKSIYGSDFQEEDLGTFSILVHVGEDEGQEATLVVSFNLEYPDSSPPVYNLSIPWMQSDQQRIIMNALEETYLSNIGQPVVYFWVEKLRELLFEMKPENLNPISKTNSLLPVSSVEDQDNSYTDDTVESAYETACKYNINSEISKQIPKITTGEPLTDRKSTFQAHVAKVNSIEDIKLVLEELYSNKKIKSATHNMYAYRIFKDDSSTACTQDCDDDGETHAGGRLLHLLQILDCRNVLVVVSRWYGGVLLYGDRFKHINNVARGLLLQEGFIPKAGGPKAAK